MKKYYYILELNGFKSNHEGSHVIIEITENAITSIDTNRGFLRLITEGKYPVLNIDDLVLKYSIVSIDTHKMINSERNRFTSSKIIALDDFDQLKKLGFQIDAETLNDYDEVYDSFQITEDGLTFRVYDGEDNTLYLTESFVFDDANNFIADTLTFYILIDKDLISEVGEPEFKFDNIRETNNYLDDFYENSLIYSDPKTLITDFTNEVIYLDSYKLFELELIDI